MRSSPDRNGQLAFRSTANKSTIEPELGLPIPREDSPPRGTKLDIRRRKTSIWLPGLLAAICCILLICLLLDRGDRVSASGRTTETPGTVLVSYSYFEKDETQLENAEFFLKVGMGVGSAFKTPRHTEFAMVVQGRHCKPCEKLRPLLTADPLLSRFSNVLSNAWSGRGLSLLWRLENEGMDFAAHNVTMEWMKGKNELKKYRYFIFLNSSVRGPFIPNYMPHGWQWTQAFTDRLSDEVKGVSSSLACLPKEDAGGHGPKLESWAFALDQKGLELTTNAGVFWLRTCKLCTDDQGIVVRGEYGISKVLLDAEYNIATLLSRYSPDTDWRDSANWDCNDNVHPSRHGTYDHISMHPYESVFVKSSWHVGQPHLDHYTKWFHQHAEHEREKTTVFVQGDPGTSGEFDTRMYRYAISETAQLPNYAEECFKVLKLPR